MLKELNASPLELVGLRKLIAEKGVKKNWLAGKVGLPHYAFSRKLHGRANQSFSRDELSVITATLGVDAAYLAYLGSQEAA